MVIAAGTQDQPLVFRNNDLPNIVMASAVQRLLRHDGVPPGSRAVIFAGIPHGAAAALDLDDAGVPVAVVVIPQAARLPEAMVSELRAEGLRIVEGATIAVAQGTRGNRRVKSLRVESPAGPELLDCDFALIGADTTPGYQLRRHAGAKLGFDEESQSFPLTGLPASMHLAGRSVAQIGVTTSRLPFGPEKLGLLAGPRQSHDRLTPMDGWHRAAGAKMIPAALWWRPLCYGDSAGVVADGVRLVREGGGMLDVSTLGKLAVRGPDAGAFLDRIYTMAHENQPVGRAALLNEA
ncbi:hypothetical protein [Paracoccus sp. MC1854]|uniref:hypothetical protein n=1 Tax=Paracoccus sp. MC1854 TaxID=2760306 RepID=UPI00351CAB0C